MQVRIFSIPVSDSGVALQELNAFLAGHRVLEMEQQFYGGQHGAFWSFCVRYLNSPNGPGPNAKVKVDYRQVLGEEEFVRFAKLRELRKTIAQQEAIPAYAIFTDEELAGIAQLADISVTSIQTVKGIGEKKAQKYGTFLMQAFLQG
jgi:superfamily II DNA helicase RecQ